MIDQMRREVNVEFEKRYAADPVRFARMTTNEIRENFLVQGLFAPGQAKMVYSFIDRVIVGSAVPVQKPLILEAGEQLAGEYFAQRREVGVINIGGKGVVTVDGQAFSMERKDVLYIGRGSQNVQFGSDKENSPALFYFVSYPAHADHPTTLGKVEDAEPLHLGTQEAANKRTIYKFIHPNGIQSCQLVMGLTELEDGNVWNTMPAHTHERRMEVYMYFDMLDGERVFHLMGRPGETRHIVMRKGEAVISPSWSIHSGVGTKRYAFVWCMGGENQAFEDMDGVGMEDIA